jgi:hypothetical protein
MTATSLKTGGCQCGKVRYEVRGEPLDLYVCHCRECQAQSASAFGISVIYPPAAFRVVSGSPRMWSRPARIRGRLDCHFCPDCGSRLWHGNLQADAVISVKGGSLDEKPDLTGAKHIWTSRKLEGIVIPPDAENWPEEPPA